MEFYTNLGEILQKIIEKAEEDGLITMEEQELINVLDITFRDLDQAIKNALEDHYLSKQEELVLREKRAKIIDEAWEVISKDNVISEDEAILIRTLLQLIKNIKVTE